MNLTLIFIFLLPAPEIWVPVVCGNSSFLCQSTNFIVAVGRGAICSCVIARDRTVLRLVIPAYHQAHPSCTRAGAGPPPRAEMNCSRLKQVFAPDSVIGRPLYRVLQNLFFWLLNRFDLNSFFIAHDVTMFLCGKIYSLRIFINICWAVHLCYLRKLRLLKKWLWSSFVCPGAIYSVFRV